MGVCLAWQYLTIQCNTLQYQTIPNNTMQYHRMKTTLCLAWQGGEEAWLGCGEVLDCIKVATAANPLETPQSLLPTDEGLLSIQSPAREYIGTSCFQFHSLISPPCPAVCVSCVLGVENEGDDPLDWLRSSIPGEPGTDYPILAATQVSIHIWCFFDFRFLVFRTVGSPATVWCLAATTPTLPLTANSTASACRTPSAQTPSTRSTSSAPTAPSSTSSSSTATGGQCLSLSLNQMSHI